MNRLVIDLEALCKQVQEFVQDTSTEQAYRPPILDDLERYADQEVHGLSRFLTLCIKELAFVSNATHSHRPPEDLSTNAPFLFAVWKEVMSASRPILSIQTNQFAAQKKSFKVDVISQNGTHWHKINTSTVDRLLHELRELDAYSEGSDGDEAYLDVSETSLIKQCKEMIQAAEMNTLPDGSKPHLIYRLTRLTGDETQDYRIQSTFHQISRMGVEIRYGEPVPPPKLELDIPSNKRLLLPTMNLNLDLSLLIAMISDITHAPLPSSEGEADRRFRPLDVRKQVQMKSSPDTHRPVSAEEAGAEIHSRALAAQLKQEMRCGLVERLEEVLSSVASATSTNLRFWATLEAIQKCRDIVDKIGGPSETARCEAMFASLGSLCSPGFWSGSRHDGALQILSRFEIHTLDASFVPQKVDSSSFSSRLLTTCSRLLDESCDVTKVNASVEDGQAVVKMKVPSPHTIRSMLEGTRRGMTTITANRLSVRQIVRNMGGFHGLFDRDTAASFLIVEPKTLAERKRLDDFERKETRPATFWVLDPRSLAESLGHL